MKTFITTSFLFLTIIVLGQTDDQKKLNTKVAIEIIKDNLDKIDTTTKVLFVNGPINTKPILDSFRMNFQIIVTKQYSAELKYFKGKMNYLSVTVYAPDNAYVEFLTGEYDPNSVGLVSVQNNSMIQYTYNEREGRLQKINTK